jgi:HD-GYP domain-containing protein (c-di-GMP phosphodiesterase class II)
VARVNASESAAAIRAVTERVLQAFVVLHRTARTHAMTNEAMQAPVQTLVDAINAMVDATGACEFLLSGTVCVANGLITVPDLGQLPAIRDVAAELRAQDVGGFRSFARADAARVRALMTALVSGKVGVAPSGEFEVLRAGPIETMLRELHETEVQNITRRDPTERALNLYAALIAVVQRTIDAARSGRQIGKALSTSRVMRELIDAGQTVPHILLALAFLRDERLPYLPRHLAGTTIMSVLVALELGLPRGELLHVANVALLHEVGVAAYGAHLETAGRDLSPEDRQLVKDLPLLSARMFLRRRGLDHESLRNVLSTVECKRPFDQPLGGATASDRTMLSARIVQACSTFDALTSNRPFRAALQIPAALAKIQSGEPRLDPQVMHALVSVVTDPSRLVVRARGAVASPRAHIAGTTTT